jgi:NAD(P)H-dependent FMN reductase
MITVISGTSREDSMTRRVAHVYEHLLLERGEKPRFLSLEGLPVWERTQPLLHTETEVLIPAKKFIFVVPEYNGSIPGVLKVLLDNTDIQKAWWGKKAMITGLADGRAGNLRGLDHLTNILNYLKVSVYWNKIPLSRIRTEITEDGDFRLEATRRAVVDQLEGFLHF